MMAKTVFVVALAWFSLESALANNLMASAPQLCPIEQGNLIDVKLFIKSEEDCFKLCEETEGCHFFRHYKSMSGKKGENREERNEKEEKVVTRVLKKLSFPPLMRPSQCFLFKSCGRSVEKASPDCKINKENTIEVKPFVKSEQECQEQCQKKRKCGYFKYFPNPLLDDSVYYEDDNLDENNITNVSTNNRLIRTNDKASNNLILGTERKKPIVPDPSLLYDTSTQKSEFCYLLRSCSKRMVDKIECTLGVNNFLGVHYFVQTSEECQRHCEVTDGCRYFWWYPIQRSETPMYCYLFQQCAAKDAEPEVSLVIGGRHPGHYYLTNEEHNDLIMRNDVCMKHTRQNVSLARAGALAMYVDQKVLFCGGRNMVDVHKDCLQYEPMADKWSYHSDMAVSRDEAGMALIGSTLYAIGGIGQRTVEKLDVKGEKKEWVAAPALPEVIARGCAAATSEGTILIVGGHDNSSTTSLASGLEFDPKTEKWTSIPDMHHPRRDHACLFVEFEKNSGLLVSGGLGEKEEVLDSVEFYDIKTKKWILTSYLKQRRTEHAMSLIYGIPTVIGGLSDTEFLSSLEQFDKSSASWNVPLQRDWRIINHALNAPRYEMAVASIPASKVGQHCSTEDNE